MLSGLWKAQQPTHNTTAVQTPTLVANLPPSSGMFHLHHTLCDQVLLLGGHEDGTEPDLLNLHLTLTLEDKKNLLDFCFKITQRNGFNEVADVHDNDGVAATLEPPVDVHFRNSHILIACVWPRGPATEEQGCHWAWPLWSGLYWLFDPVCAPGRTPPPNLPSVCSRSHPSHCVCSLLWTSLFLRNAHYPSRSALRARTDKS